MSPLFQRYIGIDYSGASTPDKGLTGLRCYMAHQAGPGEQRESENTPPLESLESLKPLEPLEITPPVASPSRYWSRSGLAHWLAETLTNAPPTLIAIDHGLSFPLAYFDAHGLTHTWHSFLDDFVAHWPLTQNKISVEDVLQGRCGLGTARLGNAKWRRLTEQLCRAKSVFHFGVQGSVAKSTHAGLPWVHWLRQQHPNLHCWPFDGWVIPPATHVLVEGYPSLWNRTLPSENRTPDQHDAYVLALQLRTLDAAQQLRPLFTPELPAEIQQQARVEGWIFGVTQPR